MMTSDSGGEHPADSFKGPPDCYTDAHVTGKNLTPKSKVGVARATSAMTSYSNVDHWHWLTALTVLRMPTQSGNTILHQEKHPKGGFSGWVFLMSFKLETSCATAVTSQFPQCNVWGSVRTFGVVRGGSYMIGSSCSVSTFCEKVSKGFVRCSSIRVIILKLRTMHFAFFLTALQISKQVYPGLADEVAELAEWGGGGFIRI
jgi:hypothetical protein